MKFFPVKVMILCLLLPPVLYAGSVELLKNYLDQLYDRKIENIFLQDTQPLLDGSVKIHNAVARNINSYLKQDNLVENFGVKLDILVITRDGSIIYPSFDAGETGVVDSYHKDPIETARENWEILNKGLSTNVSVKMGYGTKLAVLILALYLGIALLIFLFFYAGSIKKAKAHEEQTDKQIDELLQEEKEYRKILDELKNERNNLFDNISQLNRKYQDDKKKAKINEEEMFNEIMGLEEKLNSYIELKQDKEDEIQQLKFKVDELEKRKAGTGRRKLYDFMEKRFSTLYKNIHISRKALAGFLELSEEQQIKAEEVIHQLNEDSGKVIIKRKVFTGKKNKITAFEVIFAYNGRLYFRKEEDGKIEILATGTKKTQSKDMDYLHNL